MPVLEQEGRLTVHPENGPIPTGQQVLNTLKKHTQDCTDKVRHLIDVCKKCGVTWHSPNKTCWSMGCQAAFGPDCPSPLSVHVWPLKNSVRRMVEDPAICRHLLDHTRCSGDLPEHSSLMSTRYLAHRKTMDDLGPPSGQHIVLLGKPNPIATTIAQIYPNANGDLKPP